MNIEDGLDSKIAIIGMAGKFPGASDIQMFWKNLIEGKEGFRRFTEAELHAAGVSQEQMDKPEYVPVSGKLNNIELFDAPFFKYTPREAEIIDPQQRMFLECAYNAFENAGYSIDRYTGSVGVFAGIGVNKYITHILSQQDILDILDPRQIEVGNDKDFLTTRVSYKLNLTGPSMSIQTACSSSLVSVHIACQNLINGECDLALAGGVSIQFLESHGYLYKQGGIESPDGHCRAFDEESEGTVFGDGVALVLLKRLEEAVQDRDHIYAVINGSAVNNDGAEKIGYTAPGVDGQIHVISEAMEISEVSCHDVGYIEAHGTGTKLGDTIEVFALKEVFNEREYSNKCIIGSVKTNVGHLNTVAGVTGLIKTALIVKNGIIPPTLHFKKSNPQLELDKSPFSINNSLVNWPEDKERRIAGISSFGIGGTNAHVIVEAIPLADTNSIKVQQKKKKLLIISGKTKAACQKNSKNLEEFIKSHPDINMTDVAYTLQVGRNHFPNRAYALWKNDKLSFNFNKKPVSEIPLALIFLFPGQGIDYIGMAQDIYETEPYVKKIMDNCFHIVSSLFNIDIRQRLFPDNNKKASNIELNKESYSAICLFIVQYALAKLWIYWGIKPHSMIGDGIGEVVCACLADVFSLEVALGMLISSSAIKDIVTFNKPLLSFYSDKTGEIIDEAQAVSPDYWKEVVCQPYGSLDFNNKAIELEPYQCLEIVPIQKDPAYPLNSFATLSVSGTESDSTVLYNTLGQLWLDGYSIDWCNVQNHEDCHRIPLPTYAFDFLEYWLDKKNTFSKEHNYINDNNKSSFSTNLWKSSQNMFGVEDLLDKCKSTKSGWLIFSCGGELTEVILSLLQTGEQEIILVEKGEQFVHYNDNRYELNPFEYEHFELLFTQLLCSTIRPDTVLYLWDFVHMYTETTVNTYIPPEEREVQKLSTLALAIYQKINWNMNLVVFTNQFLSVLGTEKCPLVKIPVMGTIAAISQCFLTFKCYHYDLNINASGLFEEKIIAGILTKLMMLPGEDVVAVRGQQHWLNIKESLELNKLIKRKSGVMQDQYLLINGFTLPGLVILEKLAIKKKLRIIILTDIKPVTVMADSVISAVYAKIKELRGSGIEVVILETCNQNKEYLTNTIKDYSGSIPGIFCIEDTGENIIRSEDIVEVINSLAPEFVISFPISIAKATNFKKYYFLKTREIYFQALIKRNNKEEAGLITVYWPGSPALINIIDKDVKWQNTRDSLEKAVDEIIKLIFEYKGIPLLDINITDLDKDNLLLENGLLKSDPTFAADETVVNKSAIPVSSRLCMILEEIMGVSPIGETDNFFEIGGDSVVAIQFASRAKQFGINIAYDNIFDFPTIALLVKEFENNQKLKFSIEKNVEKSDNSIYHYIEQKDQATISKILDTNQLSHVYPVSSMQLLILNYNILYARLGITVKVISFEINEKLNINAFKAAWQNVVDNHSILRTGFKWRHLTNPVQFVKKQLTIEINEFDWSQLQEDKQKEEYQQLYDKEKKNSFKVDDLPQMRFFLIKLSELHYQFVWSYQNSIFDGWSSNIIYQEVLDDYSRLNMGESVLPKAAPPFLNYISWLLSQNKDTAKVFWRDQLKDFGVSNDISYDTNLKQDIFDYSTREIVISNEEFRNLKEFAKANQITINSICMGAWGLLNSSLQKKDDILIGMITSGRPPEVDGIEKMIGLFTNNIPLRINFKDDMKLIIWLQTLQKTLTKIKSFEYTTLQDIAKWSDIKSNYLQHTIYEKTLVFLNFPLNFNPKNETQKENTFEYIQSAGQLQVPLRVYITPSETLKITIEYNKKRYNNDKIQSILSGLRSILLQSTEKQIIGDLLNNI